MSNLNLNTISSLDTGREVDVNRVMQTVDYVGGLVIDSLDTVIVDGDDRYVLAASAVLPYTTTGAGMPEGGAFMSVGDSALRQDLANPDKGAAMVARALIYVDTIADLQALDTSELVDGQAASAVSGEFRWNPSDMSSGVMSDPKQGVYVAPEGQDGRQGAWVLSQGTLSVSTVFTVGPSGQFETINDALEFASKYRGKFDRDGYLIEIRLLSGFVMREAVYVQNGTDLSWIVITAEDSVVVIERDKLTVNMSGRFAAFGARQNSTLPVIGALFSMDSSGDASTRDGIFITNQCRVNVINGCGIINAGDRGLHVGNNSMAQARSSNFSGAGGICARISNNSSANLRGANLSGGEVGVAANGAWIAMADSDVSGSRESGIFAQASYIYAQGINADNCHSDPGTAGYSGAIEAQLGSVVIIAGGSVNNAGRNAITCYEATVIAWQNTPERPVTAVGAALKGIYSKSGRVVANKIDLTGCGDIAIHAVEGADIIANRAIVNGSGSWGARAEDSSRIEARVLSANGSASGVASIGGSTVSATNMVLNNTSGVSALVFTGTIVMDSAVLSNVAGAVQCIGGRMAMRNVNATRTPAGSYDIEVSQGGIISADLATGTTNVTVNTLTPNGIIFR